MKILEFYMQVSHKAKELLSEVIRGSNGTVERSRKTPGQGNRKDQVGNPTLVLRSCCIACFKYIPAAQQEE